MTELYSYVDIAFKHFLKAKREKKVNVMCLAQKENDNDDDDDS